MRNHGPAPVGERIVGYLVPIAVGAALFFGVGYYMAARPHRLRRYGRLRVPMESAAPRARMIALIAACVGGLAGAGVAYRSERGDLS